MLQFLQNPTSCPVCGAPMYKTHVDTKVGHAECEFSCGTKQQFRAKLEKLGDPKIWTETELTKTVPCLEAANHHLRVRCEELQGKKALKVA